MGERDKDSHRRRENRGHGFQGSLDSWFRPSAFSKGLRTEQSSSELGAGPEAGSLPHRLWVLYAKRHQGFKNRER